MAVICLLFTASFPYGNGEAFLEQEIEFLANEFDEVRIFPCIINGEQRTLHPKNVIVDLSLSLYLSSKSNLVSTILSFTTIRHLTDEAIHHLSKLKHIQSLKLWLQWGILAHQLSRWLPTLNQLHNTNHCIYYSYWMDWVALGLGLGKPQHDRPIISRTHGFEVYENRYAGNYLPFRHNTAQKIDKIYTVSNHAQAHLIDALGDQFAYKIETARLGTTASSGLSSMSEASKFVIYTCSRLVPLKRIDKLINALALLEKQASINHISIEWHHIGDGKIKNSLIILAQQILINTHWVFHGNIPSPEICRIYSNNPVDLFVNVSETEALPVTIMEAFSCGIPVLAPNINGIPEIVNESNGLLMTSNPSAEQIADLITKLMLLPIDKKVVLRKNAFDTWKNNYDASANYAHFAKKLHVLASTHKQY